MKKLYLIISFLFLSLCTTAQIINIPDANFKAKLLLASPLIDIAGNGSGNVKIDLNDDNEIDVAEAALITSLYLPDSNISSLQGIEAFTNLHYLECSRNVLTSLNVTTLINLTVLSCEDNLLTSLEVTPLINLTTLHCSNNLLTSIDISPLVSLSNFLCEGNSLTSLVLVPSLHFLDCSNNQLTTIDLTVLTDVGWLSVSYNHLTSLVFPELTLNGGLLDISGNEYTSIDLSPLHNTSLSDFYCNNTKLTSLAMVDFYDTNIQNNQFLSSIDFKNGIQDLCVPHPTLEDPFDFCAEAFLVYDNPNLQFVCVDDADWEAPYLQNYFAGSPNVLVSSYCDFTPGGNYNTISGTTTLDCGGSNITIENQNITITNGTDIGHTYSNSDGAFIFYTGFGNQIVSLQLEHPNFFTVTPANYVFNFPFNESNTETANFCLTANGVHPDLVVTIFPLDSSQPGFDAHYKIVYKNNGNQTQSGSVSLNYDDAIEDYVTSSPVFSSQDANSLTWDFTDLAPFETRSITVAFNVNSPQETPPVNNGDILVYNSDIVSSQADETPVDNHSTLNQTVVGSYDPNDKTVVEGFQLNESQTDDYLHYIIRFQNTGTAAAQNIVVKDMLSNKLDWSTLEMVSSSHPYRSTLTVGNKLEVFYENINLPAESNNEPASHGYIAFKVKPISSFGLGDTIENTANIYFDFNFPVVTNTVSSTVVALGNSNYNAGKLFTLYPNPTSAVINIAVSNNQLITKTTINNLLGQTIMTVENESTLDISSLTKGTYFITVQTDSGKETQKIIKM